MTLVELIFEEVVHRALSPLDLRTQHRLATNVHRYEEIGVWQCLSDSIKTPERQVRLGAFGSFANLPRGADSGAAEMARMPGTILAA